MAIGRIDILALGAAGAVALAMPVWLLRPGTPVIARPAAGAPPLSAQATPPLTQIYARALFGSGGSAGEDDATLPGDAPQLVGIVGRIGSDAVAMVRSGDSSRTLEVGESIDGWTLRSLASDAAFFTRGGQRVRVPMASN